MPSWSSAVPGSGTPSLKTPGNAELQLGIPPKHLEQGSPNRGHQTPINPPATPRRHSKFLIPNSEFAQSRAPNLNQPHRHPAPITKN